MESKDKSRVVMNSVKPIHQPSSEERSTIRTQHRRAVEELVKHMSNVPSYLQGMDQPDNLQSKALNFGVIDWGRLEKWAYDQRPSVERTAGDSKSTSDASQSCHRTSFSHAYRKKSSSLSRSEPSTSSWDTKTMDEESTNHVTGSSDSRASSKHTSAGHRQLSEMQSCIGVDHSAHHRHHRGKTKDKKKIASNSSQPQEMGAVSPTLKDYERRAFQHNKVNVRNYRLKGPEKVHTSNSGNCFNNLSSARVSPERKFLTVSQKTEGLPSNVHEGANGRCSGVNAAAVNDQRPSHNCISAYPPHENVQCCNQSPDSSSQVELQISKSKDRKERHDQSSEYSEQQHSKSKSRQAKHYRSTDVFELHSSKSKGMREKHEHSTEELVTSVVGRSREDELNANGEAGRELSPRHHSGASLSWTKRCPSSRGGLSVEQMGSNAAPSNSHAEKTIVNDRSRKSPLRRMLGPLLKPRNLIHFSGPIAASSKCNPNDPRVIERPHVQEESTPRRWSFDATLNFFSSQVKDNLSSSGQIPLFQGEKHEASTIQALLQLTWKDGLPLFTLTSDDSILVATLRKKIIRAKGKFECVYTILSVHEVKKKSRERASQRNKDKNNGLVSNVVGQLKVSCSKLDSFDIKGDCVVKEFVLFGAELVQEAHEPLNSMSKNELAAIVIKMPKGRAGTSLQNLLHSCMDSPKMSSDDDKCSGQIQQGNYGSISSSTIVVILPSGAHGYSATTEPTPLIERWKSGGQCDCGGWDEGCKLTILTDEVPGNCDSSQASHGTDGTNPIKLFVQGGSQDKRHAFSIIAFKEGLYMLNFGASISSLQAFAISLAILHNCNNISHSQTGGEPVTNYVPDHPPPSPVGRA